MVVKCSILGCSTNSLNRNDKVSIFRVPKNPDLFKAWKQTVPRNALQLNHYVCSKHFRPSDIVTRWCINYPDGRVCQQGVYNTARLNKKAVPCFFPNTIHTSGKISNNQTLPQNTQKLEEKANKSVECVELLTEGSDEELNEETVSSKKVKQKNIATQYEMVQGNSMAVDLTPSTDLKKNQVNIPFVEVKQEVVDQNFEMVLLPCTYGKELEEMSISNKVKVEQLDIKYEPVQENSDDKELDIDILSCEIEQNSKCKIPQAKRTTSNTILKEFREQTIPSNKAIQSNEVFEVMQANRMTINLPSTAWSCSFIDTQETREIIFSETAYEKDDQMRNILKQVIISPILQALIFIDGIKVRESVKDIHDVEQLLQHVHGSKICIGGPIAKDPTLPLLSAKIDNKTNRWRHIKCTTFTAVNKVCAACSTVFLAVNKMERKKLHKESNPRSIVYITKINKAKNKTKKQQVLLKNISKKVYIKKINKAKNKTK